MPHHSLKKTQRLRNGIFAPSKIGFYSRKGLKTSSDLWHSIIFITVEKKCVQMCGAVRLELACSPNGIHSFYKNVLLFRFLLPLFQNETKCKTFQRTKWVVRVLLCHVNQINFHSNGFETVLVLKKKQGPIRNWAISSSRKRTSQFNVANRTFVLVIPDG